MGYSNEVNAKQETINRQKNTIQWMGGFIVLLIIAVIMLPRDITLHNPPDLSEGSTMKIGEIPEPNVYQFAYYIFQQLNRWPNNGATDYEDKIHMLKNYLTPACFQERLEDFEAKKNKQQLSNRQRSVWEIPGRGFSSVRVKQESHSSWLVYLDLHISETMFGEPVKDRLVNYPLRIVRYVADQELNPYNMALDCFAAVPRVIEPEKDDEIATR